ncbi:MAG: GNAT family N-acetyltransferase [Bacteroidetes bacterium]|mgnify:FL=1|nr:GNAT family N-acetyltransferase [Bacteroidota bacterium]
MQIVKLIKANNNDVLSIAELAKTIWHQHYPSIISIEQINYMLNKMYCKQSLEEQINVLNHKFYFIMFENEKIGFISVNETEPNNWHINKFYILQTIAAKGVGTHCFNEILKLLTPKKITLTVNRKNYKSINFYFKNGFKINEVKDFDIGNGYLMEDFIMAWGN